MRTRLNVSVSSDESRDRADLTVHVGTHDRRWPRARYRHAYRAMLAALLAACAIVASGATASAQQFQVVGTCGDGICGLNIRNGPGYSNYAKIGGLYDGNNVDVICQTRGQLVTPGHTPATNVWDQIVPAGSYVTDAYINTPGRGSGTFSLQRCPPSASIASPGGGGTYVQGQSVGTSFSCSEALGEGDSIQSCADSHGGSGSAGTLDTSTPGAHTYTVTATSTDGATGNASISYTVIGTPTAKIDSPANKGRFLQGSTVATSFECVEGAGGPGIQSCSDSNGGSGGTGSLDTTALGPQTYSVTAKSGDGASATAEITYSVVAAKASCTGNSGKVNYSPGITNTPAVQIVKVKGALTGCSGSAFTGAKYSATLKTSQAVTCATLTTSLGAPATGPLIARWTPKAKGAESNGTLNIAVTAVPGTPLSGSLESGPLSPSALAANLSQTFAKAASCGTGKGTRPPAPLRAATFAGTTVQLY